MKATDLLHLLNKQTNHLHEQSQQPPLLDASHQSVSLQKHNTQSNQSQHKYAIPFNHSAVQINSTLDEESALKQANNKIMMGIGANELELEGLGELLDEQIGSLVSESMAELIEEAMKVREKSTFEAFTKKDNQYLEILMEHSQLKDQQSFQMISQFLSNREQRVSNQLNNGQLILQTDRKLNNRTQLQLANQLDLARMIKIKDGQLKSKIDIFNDKLDQLALLESISAHPRPNHLNQINHQIIQNMSPLNYSLDSEKTKIAKDYVKYMQQQKKLLENRKKQRNLKQQKFEQERQSELIEAAEMRDLAKQQQLLQKIEAKRKKKEDEERQLLARDEQVQKLLDEYRKHPPLFKRKQLLFNEQILVPEQKYREEKLHEIRENRKSMSLQDMKLHQEKYMVRLQNDKMKREEELKLIMDSRKVQDKAKPYFKGQSHDRIKSMTKQEKLRNQENKEASMKKMARIDEYKKKVKLNHQPLLDEKKKNELIKSIHAEEMKKNHMKKMYRQIRNSETNEILMQSYYVPIPIKNLYEEGNKFLEISKRYVKKKDERSLQPQTVESEKAGAQSSHDVKLLQESANEKKSEKNIWEIRAQQLTQITNEEVRDAKKFEQMKINLENLDNKAVTKENALKHLNMSMEEHIQEKGMLDQYYLESIRNKMKLLD